MPSPAFVDAVLAVVARIPAGRVMTYGDVATAIGSSAPRAVGQVLALYGHASPWWRVVPASGLPPQGHAALALPHYLAEQTPLRRTGARSAVGSAAPDGSASRPHASGRAAGAENTEDDPNNYRIALSAARLPFTHEIYAEVAL